MICKQASTRTELLGILDLQARNHKDHLPLAQQKQQGFLTVRHDLPLLEKMNHLMPQIIAMDQDQIAGYALTMDRSLAPDIPVLTLMIETIDQVSYQEEVLGKAHYYVMGQVCIDIAYRGKRLFDQLYARHKQYYSQDFSYCITGVSARNLRSMKAHTRVGFKTVHTLVDPTDTWHILLWDWT